MSQKAEPMSVQLMHSQHSTEELTSTGAAIGFDSDELLTEPLLSLTTFPCVFQSRTVFTSGCLPWTVAAF